MKAIICALATLITSTAMAYKDGTYSCKMGDGGIPDRVIKITTVNVGGGPVPYVHVTHSYKEGTGLKTVEVSGFATLHNLGDDKEAMMLAALRFDFVKDEIQNCRK